MDDVSSEGRVYSPTSHEQGTDRGPCTHSDVYIRF